MGTKELNINVSCIVLGQSKQGINVSLFLSSRAALRIFTLLLFIEALSFLFLCGYMCLHLPYFRQVFLHHRVVNPVVPCLPDLKVTSGTIDYNFFPWNGHFLGFLELSCYPTFNDFLFLPFSGFFLLCLTKKYFPKIRHFALYSFYLQYPGSLPWPQLSHLKWFFLPNLPEDSIPDFYLLLFNFMVWKYLNIQKLKLFLLISFPQRGHYFLSYLFK